MAVAASLYDWLLFLHIFAAMVWVGGVTVLAALGTHVLRRRDPAAARALVASLRVIGPLALAPAVGAVLALGIWLVVDSDSWDFGQRWILVALALLIAAFVVGAAFQSRAALAAERAATAGDDGETLRQLGRWVRGMWLILVLLVVATWDMAVKPGL